MSRYDVPPLVEEQSRVTAVVPDGPSAGVPPLVAAGYPHRTSWLEDGPTHGAVVFSFDEKTQCEALDRTQPSLPMTPGRAETMTYACKRNGITDLFVAMNVATGEVIYDTKPRHSAKEVLAFFKSINVHVPEHLEVHVVLDNLSANKAPPVANWLAHPKRVRWHLHFTTTSSSWWWWWWWWLNLVECWFSLLTARRLKRGVFTSVDALTEAIGLWAEHWNDNPKALIWKKTADEIIAKVQRGRAALTTQTKSATHH